MGHGQVPHQAVSEKHRRHHQQASWTDRRRSKDEIDYLQQSQGKPTKSREEANVSNSSFLLFLKIAFDTNLY